MRIDRTNIGRFLSPFTLLFWGLLAIALIHDIQHHEKHGLTFFFHIYVIPAGLAFYLISTPAVLPATFHRNSIVSTSLKLILLSPLLLCLLGTLAIVAMGLR